MRVVKFTDLGGNPVWIFDTWVQEIREVVGGEAQPNARCAIVLSGFTQFVLEDVKECIERLK